MSVLADFDVVLVNPLNVEEVFPVIAEQKVEKEGQEPKIEKVYEVHIRFISGHIRVLEAKTQDGVAQTKLLNAVVDRINAGLNTNLTVE